MSSVIEDSLTKTKKKPNIVIKETTPLISEPALVVPEIPIQVSQNDVPQVVEKVKKPRTEKQIEAFKKSAQKRAENIAITKQKKKMEQARALLASYENTPVIINEPKEEPVKEKEVKVPEVKPKKKRTKITLCLTDSSDDDDEYQDSHSTDDDNSSSDISYEKKPRKKADVMVSEKKQPVVAERNFTSQQNRKSKITMKQPAAIDYDKYFAD